jgi:hypothetical protein
MDIFSAANHVQKIGEVGRLREPGQLTGVAEADVNEPPDAIRFQEVEELSR